MTDQFTLGPEFKGFKKMLRKDLAAELGISGAMVSKLAKRGMPTDSVERAQRWRKRHLEPGRVKGSRFDPNYTAPPAPEPAVPPAPAAPAPPSAGEIELKLTRAAEVAAKCVGIALRVDGLASIPPLIAELRDGLRELPPGAEPGMPLRVWVALVDWVLRVDSEVRSHPDQDQLLAPGQFAALAAPAGDADGLEWLHAACDWNDGSLLGELDDEDVS